MAVAKVKGKLLGTQPKLSKKYEEHLISVHRVGTHMTVEIAELFGVARATVYRAIHDGNKTGTPLENFRADFPQTLSSAEDERTKMSTKQPLGYFHAIRTSDAVAQTRDGWPYFVLYRRGLDSRGEALCEIQFGDGEWMLAVVSDLEPTDSPSV